MLRKVVIALGITCILSACDMAPESAGELPGTRPTTDEGRRDAVRAAAEAARNSTPPTSSDVEVAQSALSFKCLAWRTNPLWWQAVAAMKSLKALGWYTKADCYADAAESYFSWIPFGGAKCACDYVF